MDNLHRQESWLGGSLSAPRVRSGQLIALPFAAHFASSTLTTSSGAAANNISNTSSLVAPQPSPELEDVFAKMRKHLENGKWGPEDSNALLSLLDEGWYSRSNKSKRNTPRATSNSVANDRPSTDTASTVRNGQIPAIRPLNLASLRDHTTNASPSEAAIDSGVMFSARSTATTRWAAAAAAGGRETNDWAGLDTPRSWVTAASMAASLPQSNQEMDAMDIEQVRQLVEDADALQQRAAVALKLAQARLRKNHRRQCLSWSAVFFLGLHMGLVLINALVDVGLIVLEIIVRLVSGQRSCSPGKVANIYSVVGAVVGAAQGICTSILGSSTSTEN